MAAKKKTTKRKAAPKTKTTAKRKSPAAGRGRGKK